MDQWSHLKTAQVNGYENQYVLEYTLVGAPDETAGEAFGTLFKVFFKLKGEYGLEMQPPMARWPDAHEKPYEEWTGKFAVVVNEKIKTLPAEITAEYPSMKLAIWEQGNVAEILHIGAYGDVSPAIHSLQDYISSQKLKIKGPYEEVYIKGPGMFFKGNPKNYQTIIRYAVESQ